MKPSYQSSKLYQADLYDQIKSNGNHIVCLGQDQTKTFILLAAIRNRAHQLHPKYGSHITVIIEPDKEHADERQRMILDHTELRVANMFNQTDQIDDGGDGGDEDEGDDECQIFITPIRYALSGSKIKARKINLIILDCAHLTLLQDVRLVQDVVNRFRETQILVFMCSLIHNSQDLTPINTIQLINQLESIFMAKCETSSDLRSLSRQSPLTNMEVLEFNSSELFISEQHLLNDSMLKSFCDFMLESNLDDNEPLIKPEVDFPVTPPNLNHKKQLVLVRSCLSDIIYAIHCLGLWCAKKTIQLYLTEFSRLLQNEHLVSDLLDDEYPIGDLIASASSVLNCLYSRLDEIMLHYNHKSQKEMLIDGSTQQIKTLLDYIKEAKPTSNIVTPLCVIHVRRRVIAKVLALWLDKIANNYEEYSFMKPNYIVGSSRKHRNRLAVDNFDLHHEASVRDFRFGNCNILVSSAISERCTDMPRCNLVVSFDLPARFSDFIQAKGNCRFDSSRYIIMLNNYLDSGCKSRLLSYINMERLLNNVTKKVALESRETTLMEELEAEFEPYPSKVSKNPATIWRSTNIINKYCTKLPSDSFTKLSPEWCTKEVEGKNGKGTEYYCEIKLPINSPVRHTIIGPKAPTSNIAMRLAAFTACKVLHKAGELDDNMMPITKESMKTINPLGPPREPNGRPKGNSKGQSLGSTKHRQYYEKRIAEVFSGPRVCEGSICYLYKFRMVLTCPIPDEQNRRGRRIIDPGETKRNYAIVCTRKLPKICSFPVFTRSGEVLISVDLVQQEFTLQSNQVKDLRTFHEYTFSKVLRLEKYPTIFDPDNSPFTVLLAPVIDMPDGTDIDWNFVDKIVRSNQESYMPDLETRKKFQINLDDYVDAVVIPWYRLTDRQQFAYYVAEICTDLSPSSPFPDVNSGFKTFIDYYKSKYEIDIFNKEQPVLDVDHTSARLNLLTPRYVNRKGRTLPSSTAKTRRESRESLVQKQLLIPELCSIHPFPASFWRKAVCLPCIFYRLNSLFLAEELRRKVAQETRIGFVEPPEDYEWPSLDFGWSLKDVINNRSPKSDDDDVESSIPVIHKDYPRETWSFSDDEACSDDGNCYFGEWKDSKTKNRPLLRELFLPCNKNAIGQTSNETELLYQIMRDYSSNCNGTTNHDLVSNTIELLDVKSIEGQEEGQKLIEILKEMFDKKLDICENEIIKALKSWYSTMNSLSSRAELLLNENPDLFQDNGIELIAVDDSLSEYNLEIQPTFGELLPNRDDECNWSSEDWKNIRFDPTKKEIKSVGPGPSVILQALTMSNASDGINLERLETVGDSFLKYSITANFYCMYPKMHEGKLSYLRSTEISNANLYQLGRSKNLGELMSATKFEPNDNWLAPGYSVAESAPDGVENNKKREIDKALAEVPYDLLLQHSIPDKSIADCVEALIGAYLTASGSRAALLFMQWLGLRVIPPSFDLEADLRQADEPNNEETMWRWLDTPPSPLILIPPTYDEKFDAKIIDEANDLSQLNEKVRAELDRLYYANNLDKFEKEIGYEFKDKAYIVQAFTHNSFYENHVTDCHQRLEFLGDALLDYLITRYLFEDPRCHSPGTLTDLRSALVNNTFFASLAVKYKFHKYLKYISDELFHVIDGFVRKFRFDSKDTITKGYTLLISEGESEYAEDIEVPKALGDVFESVAGAIYLDSDMSLDQVWRVYFKMMKPEIEYFSSNVPKSPIRELLESMPQNVRFSPSELAPDRKHRVIAEVFGLGRFTGVGRNKHSAKSTAAKRALRMLALKKKQLETEQANNPVKGAGDNESIGYFCFESI